MGIAARAVKEILRKKAFLIAFPEKWLAPICRAALTCHIERKALPHRM
jgi:hypothetical protein